jgi:hypothetical protein
VILFSMRSAGVMLPCVLYRCSISCLVVTLANPVIQLCSVQ